MNNVKLITAITDQKALSLKNLIRWLKGFICYFVLRSSKEVEVKMKIKLLSQLTQ